MVDIGSSQLDRAHKTPKRPKYQLVVDIIGNLKVVCGDKTCLSSFDYITDNELTLLSAGG